MYMATPARTVQLRTTQQVMDAYLNWDNPQFAILNGKQLLFAYDNDNASIEEGEQLLQQWLAWIKGGGSAGIYTLAIYRDTKKGITNTTPYNGSINFQLNEYNYGGAGVMGSVGNPELKLILDQMQAMQLQITKLQDDRNDDDDDDDGESDALGRIARLLDNPVVVGLISTLMPYLKPQRPSATMQPVSGEPGNVSRIAGPPVTTDPQQQMADSLAKLQAAISDLPGVLAQLAKMAERNPGQLKFYISLLMKMKM